MNGNKDFGIKFYRHIMDIMLGVANSMSDYDTNHTVCKTFFRLTYGYMREINITCVHMQYTFKHKAHESI